MLQGGSLPELIQKRGGGVYEYVRSFDIVDSFWYISHCAACLHR